MTLNKPTVILKVLQKSTFTKIESKILPQLLLGRLSFMPDGVSINGRFEAERPPAMAGPPSGGRAAFMTPMHPL